MIAAIIAAIAEAERFLDSHPEVSRLLLEQLRDILGIHEDEPAPNVEAMRGLAAGIAAATANAVQHYERTRARDPWETLQKR